MPMQELHTRVLPIADSISLGHAWIQSLVDELGVRAIFIKGPALTQQGLRGPHVSSDVDLLTDPAHFDRVCEELLRLGWRERPVPLIAALTTTHSRTFMHERWPCDLDVHRHYPGFLASPAATFETLWRTRHTVTLAHRECVTTSRPASVIVLALHSLRSTARQARHLAELDHLASARMTERERQEVGRLAGETGADVTLAAFLARVGITPAGAARHHADDAVRRWNERVASGSFGSYFWIAAFREGRGRDRARIAWQAVWPTREDLLLSRPETRDTVGGRVAARCRRWVRGARTLPRAVRAIMTARATPTTPDLMETRWN